jgi:hypothetical protein
MCAKYASPNPPDNLVESHAPPCYRVSFLNRRLGHTEAGTIKLSTANMRWGLGQQGSEGSRTLQNVRKRLRSFVRYLCDGFPCDSWHFKHGFKIASDYCSLPTAELFCDRSVCGDSLVSRTQVRFCLLALIIRRCFPDTFNPGAHNHPGAIVAKEERQGEAAC